MIIKRITISLFAVAFLAGCQSRSNSPDPLADMGPLDSAPLEDGDLLPEPGLQPASQQRFSDVPLPAGVVEDFDRTYIFESKDLQIGRMVYRIKASVAEVARFYIREGGRAGWTLDSVLQADGAELVFRKPAKRLRVTIRDSGIRRGTLLVIHLTPEIAGGN